MSLITIYGDGVYNFGTHVLPYITGLIGGIGLPAFLWTISARGSKKELLQLGVLGLLGGIVAGYIIFQFWWALANGPVPVCWSANPISFVLFLFKGSFVEPYINRIFTYVPQTIL